MSEIHARYDPDAVFELADGTRLAGRTWTPPNPRAAWILLHGSESHALWFDEIGPALAAEGAAVLAFDRPGWGASPGPRGVLHGYSDALRYVAEPAARARELYGAVGLAGLSWGGLLALYAALRRGALFDAVALVAPGLASKGTVPAWRVPGLLRAHLANRPGKLFPLPFRPEDFTRRTDRRAMIRDDPLRVTRVSVGFAAETFKMRRFVAGTAGTRRTPPLLCLLAGQDRIVDNPATRAIAQRAGATVEVYEESGHSLVFEEPRRVAADLSRWLGRALRARDDRRSLRNDPPPERPRPDIDTDRTTTSARWPRAVEAVEPAVVIMGAGAVGSLVGALLALGGVPVVLVARPAHAECVERDGLLLSIGGVTRRVGRPLRAVVRPEDAPAEPALAILAVKSFDTPAALADLRARVGPRTILASLQNGLSNEALIARAFPENTLIAGAIVAYATLEGPGRVAWADDKGGLAGACAAGDSDAAGSIWRTILPATGMRVDWREGPLPTLDNDDDPAALFRGGPAAASVKWSKLLMNVAFNALNAVTGQGPGQIMAHPEYGRLAAAALQEGFAVMRRLGIAPVDLPGYPIRVLARLSRLPTGALRRLLALGMKNESGGAGSMRQDLARSAATGHMPRPGRPPGLTEVDEINGAVIQAARSLSIPCPANDRLRDMVAAAAGGNRGTGIHHAL